MKIEKIEQEPKKIIATLIPLSLGIIALVAIIAIAIQSQRYKDQKNIIFDPFTGLNSTSSDLQGKKISFGKKTITLPSKAGVYEQSKNYPSVIYENEGLDNLKKKLDFSPETEAEATEGIFWYEDQQYMTVDQNSKSLIFSSDIRQSELTPQKGICQNPDLFQQTALDFLKTQKLINNQYLDLHQITIIQEEISPIGLIPVEQKNQCQAVSLTFNPQIDSIPLFNEDELDYIRIMGEGQSTKICSFRISNRQISAIHENLPLKSLNEIKQYLQEGNGVYASKYHDFSGEEVQFEYPQAYYYLNNTSDHWQLVFMLREKADNEQNIILLRAYKEYVYKN